MKYTLDQSSIKYKHLKYLRDTSNHTKMFDENFLSEKNELLIFKH